MYENNKVVPPDDIKIKLAEFFNVSVDYLLGRTDIEQKIIADKEIVRLPIIGVIRAGQPILAVENIEGHHIIERRFLKTGYEYFFLRVVGDSMNVIAPEGSLVLVRRQDSVDNGDIAIVLIDGQEATIKKFFMHGDYVTLMPMSTNKNHQPQIYDTKEIEIKIIGKAEKIINLIDL